MHKEFKRRESKLQQEQQTAIRVASLQSSVNGVRILGERKEKNPITEYIKEKLGITSWVENL